MEVALTSSSSPQRLKASAVALDDPLPPHEERTAEEEAKYKRSRKRRNIIRAKDPTTTINNFHVSNLTYFLDIQRLRVDLNLTLAVDLSVRNKNKVSFKYHNCTAALNYRGHLVGVINIPAGNIPSDDTKRLDITLTIMADHLLLDDSQDLFSDVVAGVVPMNTYLKMSGKVKIFGIFKIHVRATSSCNFNFY
ncbi:hypothetical protein G4B88_003155 [Cannabis sativa]|uniref:Late embryogenesis abundant protein LEA-2 subgroup domain-containing protein n=1 Tax=Cannabis sativa TaxID=3483 RepID=A0A7J6DTA8_CANSA|nr:hypothetical protein G4B88_003155 [Cannabis sativa]